ncbi:uncharacterized protein LOC128236913 [Mya arenaria]|uniref:uncharacterized protein LOC128236913 n=1 Tax=Mya arenaria TaxID=6604 RepID=UPI0022E4EB62|nr:uncharacterized protein LOC128236913 [Mya arenaria]
MRRIGSQLDSNNVILLSIYIFFLIMAVSSVSEACGSYKKINGGGSATIDTGSNYGANAHCTWWLETDAGYQLSMVITYQADSKTDRCGDYFILYELEAASANDSSELDWSSNCTDLTNYQVTAQASWLKVEFISDALNTTSGFQGAITSTANANASSFSTPINDCKSFEWKCPNKVCLPLSYRCDGFNDCGYEGDDSDEDGCQGLGFNKYMIMLIGGIVGFGIFLVFFIFSCVYESYVRRKALMADPDAQAELQRRKADKKRRDAYKKAAKEKKSRH